MESQICNETLENLFDKLKVLYDQNDMNNFYISSRNVFGYKVTLMSYNKTPRIYTVWNYAVEADRKAFANYQEKCFNCDMCTIVQPNGVLNVYSPPESPVETAITKENIANKFCVHLEQNPTNGIHKTIIISASDDQYTYGHALLTTSDHIPNHYTFMYKEIYATIFTVLESLSKQYPDVTAYFNGRLGSSRQHSHVHISPDRSYVAKHCIKTTQDPGPYPIEYKGIKGCLLKFAKEDVLSPYVHHLMQIIVLQNIISNPDTQNALGAHMFLDDKHYYVFFMVLKDLRVRSCDVVAKGNHIQVSLIPALSIISLYNPYITEEILETLFSPDLTDGSIPLQKCLTKFNQSYKEYKEILPSISSFADLETKFKEIYDAAVKNYYIPIMNAKPLAQVLPIMANIDQYYFSFFHNNYNAMAAEAGIYDILKQYKLLTDSDYTFTLNIIASHHYGYSGTVLDDLLQAYSYILLKSFASKLGAIQSGVCYALRGDYLQPRIKDTIDIISTAVDVKGNLNAYPLIAKGGYGSVYRSTNIFNKFPIKYSNFNANVIIKKQLYGTDAIAKARVEEELKNGQMINHLRKTLPNFTLTYGGSIGPTEGLLFVEDIPGYTMQHFLNSDRGMTFSWEGLYNITISLLASIYMAKKENGFTHYDLHVANVLLLPLIKCGASGKVAFEYEIPMVPPKKVNAVLEYLPVIIDYGFVFVDGRGPFTDFNPDWFRDELSFTADIHTLLISIMYYLNENSFHGTLTAEEAVYREFWLFLFCVFCSQYSGVICDITVLQMTTNFVPNDRSRTLQNYLGSYYTEIQKAGFSRPFHLPDQAFIDALPEPLRTNFKKADKSQSVFENLFSAIDIFSGYLPKHAFGMKITSTTQYDKGVSKMRPGALSRRFKKMLDDRDLLFPKKE